MQHKHSSYSFIIAIGENFYVMNEEKMFDTFLLVREENDSKKK